MADHQSLQLEKERSLLHHHKETHFTASEVVRDIIIGVSDGLTVPFALAAGLSSANAPSSIVLTAGIVKVAAGAISMGLGGFVLRTPWASVLAPRRVRTEAAEILAEYGVEPHEYAPVVNARCCSFHRSNNAQLKVDTGKQNRVSVF